MDIKKTLKSLCTLTGVSGCECSVADRAKELLSAYGTVTTDKLGSVILTRQGEGKHFLLDAHLDQIGLVVTGIGDSGFLQVGKVGGVDLRTLCGAVVTVWGKEPLFGVVCSTPPHLMASGEGDKAAEIKDIYIDIGLTRTRAEELVSLGDRVSFVGKFEELAGSVVTSASLDNRVGMAVILRCLDILAEKESKAKVTVTFTVQEEAGCVGAAPAVFGVEPDFALVTDVSFATAPGVPEQGASPMGSGAMIGISPSLDTGVYTELQRVAKYYGVPYTLEVMGGSTGTNADKVLSTGNGTKTGLISVPIRNMHTPVECVDLRDVEAAAQVMAHFILTQGDEDE